MATREPPPLSLGRLRGSDRLTALDFTHLRFEPAESPAFVERVVGATVSAEDVASREGLRGLLELQALYEARHDTLRLIELLALQALAHRGQGDTEAALATLERALALAAPGGLIRTFVDLGPPLAALLVELARRTERREYASRLLPAFSDDRRPVVPATSSREGAFPLFEPLTDREVDVLRLLAARYTNKAIAARLHISRHTVTTHTVSIYQKLQVTGRRDAARRARDLGLLE
jgi:LuxR family transcriptional regulator, maltose regulon positive regulatory protein